MIKRMFGHSEVGVLRRHPRTPRGILVDSDMSVPSARTSLHISQSLLEAATDIQEVLLVDDFQASPGHALPVPGSRLRRWLERRRQLDVIELDVR